MSDGKVRVGKILDKVADVVYVLFILAGGLVFLSIAIVSLPLWIIPWAIDRVESRGRP